MAELKIAVIEDDPFRRDHVAQELDRSPHIAVVYALSQHEAAGWTRERWEGLDLAIVDVYDEYAPGQLGTDVFSGIPCLEALQYLDVRTLAISPHRHHPLVEHRIFQAGADYLYRSHEITDLDKLEYILLNPDRDHVPVPVPRRVLKRFGADQARTNKAVAAYERSALYGRLYEGMIKRATGMTRKTVDRFTLSIADTGFDGPPDGSGFETLQKGPTWRHVRDYLLVLTGRKDSPPTDLDGRQ